MGALDEITRRQKAAAVLYLEKFTDAYLAEGDRIVPLEEGTLAGTADRETTVTPDGAVVTASFGTVYAARQHEDLTLKHRAGRQAKYLEIPHKAAIPRLAPGMAAAVRAVTRR